MKKNLIQDKLKRFEEALGKTTLTAEQKRKYLNIKSELLKRENISRRRRFPLLETVTRYRNGEPVWYGVEAEDELYAGVEPRRVHGLTKIGEFTVYLPSKSADKFCPSAFLTMLQIGFDFNRDMKYQILVEFRFPSADVSACYDKILECHVVTAVIYHDVQHIMSELEQERSWLEQHLHICPRLTL